jgi:hypothetical protein
VLGAEVLGAEVLGAEVLGAEVLGAEVLGAVVDGAAVLVLAAAPASTTSPSVVTTASDAGSDTDPRGTDSMVAWTGSAGGAGAA